MERNILDELTERMLPNIDGVKSMSYLIALEAFRRGLEVEFLYSINYEKLENIDIFNKNVKEGYNDIHYKISDSNKSFLFNRGLSNAEKNEKLQLSDNKVDFKKLMIKNGVSVPLGFLYDKKDKILKSRVYSSDKMFIIKPNLGSRGIGFIDNLSFKKALSLSKKNHYETLIEEKVYGDEYRIYIINNKIVSAFNRKLPVLIGNNKKTLLELYNEKYEKRKNNPAYKEKPLPTHSEVEKTIKNRYNISDIWNYIPENSETLIIGDKTSLSEGADLFECLDNIPEKVCEEALKAHKVLDFNFSGIDIIYNKEENRSYVLEINNNPFFRLLSTKIQDQNNHSYNDIAVKLIDNYFPDSKRIEGMENINFDFNSIVNNLMNGQYYSIKLPIIDKDCCVKEIRLDNQSQKENQEFYNNLVSYGINFFVYKKDSSTYACIYGKKDIIDLFSKNNKKSFIRKII